MARRTTPTAVWAAGGLAAVLAVGAGWYLSRPEPEPEPEVVEDDDTGMSEEVETKLLQEIGYLK